MEDALATYMMNKRRGRLALRLAGASREQVDQLDKLSGDTTGALGTRQDVLNDQEMGKILNWADQQLGLSGDATKRIADRFANTLPQGQPEQPQEPSTALSSSEAVQIRADVPVKQQTPEPAPAGGETFTVTQEQQVMPETGDFQAALQEALQRNKQTLTMESNEQTQAILDDVAQKYGLTEKQKSRIADVTGQFREANFDVTDQQAITPQFAQGLDQQIQDILGSTEAPEVTPQTTTQQLELAVTDEQALQNSANQLAQLADDEIREAVTNENWSKFNDWFEKQVGTRPGSGEKSAANALRLSTIAALQTEGGQLRALPQTFETGDTQWNPREVFGPQKAPAQTEEQVPTPPESMTSEELVKRGGEISPQIGRALQTLQKARSERTRQQASQALSQGIDQLTGQALNQAAAAARNGQKTLPDSAVPGINQMSLQLGQFIVNNPQQAALRMPESTATQAAVMAEQGKAREAMAAARTAQVRADAFLQAVLPPEQYQGMLQFREGVVQDVARNFQGQMLQPWAQLQLMLQQAAVAEAQQQAAKSGIAMTDDKVGDLRQWVEFLRSQEDLSDEMEQTLTTLETQLSNQFMPGMFATQEEAPGFFGSLFGREGTGRYSTAPRGMPGGAGQTPGATERSQEFLQNFGNY
jgi:hypothetical protein